MFDSGPPPPRPPSRGSTPTIVDWLFLAHFAPDTTIATDEAAGILKVGAIHVRRLIRDGKLKATRRRNRHALVLKDVLDARISKLGENGGAS